MQRSELVELSKIGSIVDSIFQEPAIAYEDYSDFDSELKKFDGKQPLLDRIGEAVASNARSVSFAIYYPEAKGYFFKERKYLNPEKCNGATYRFTASGWGLVHLQIDLKSKSVAEIRVTVNSAKRAEAWLSTCPEYKDPSLWDWKYVEKQARRIIRVLRKFA